MSIIMDFLFHAHFEVEPDGGYLVTFPDVPEAITQGDDLTEARASAADALGVALRGRLADGEVLPVPAAAGAGLIPIPVDPETALKIAVILAYRASGISKAEFARRLGKAANEPYRILDPDHPTKLKLLNEALAVLGKEMVVTVRDAA